jgi:hypothetical protein
MKVLKLMVPVEIPVRKYIERVLWGVIGMLVWALAPLAFPLAEGNAIEIARSIGLMAMLALVVFAGLLGLCWWLLNRFWVSVGLPGTGCMVLQFRRLEIWQQLGFYFAAFALVLLAGVGCLMAVV